MQSEITTKDSTASKSSTTATATVMKSHLARPPLAAPSLPPKRGADSIERDERRTRSGSTASSGSIRPAGREAARCEQRPRSSCP